MLALIFGKKNCKYRLYPKTNSPKNQRFESQHSILRSSEVSGKWQVARRYWTTGFYDNIWRSFDVICRTLMRHCCNQVSQPMDTHKNDTALRQTLKLKEEKQLRTSFCMSKWINRLVTALSNSHCRHCPFRLVLLFLAKTISISCQSMYIHLPTIMKKQIVRPSVLLASSSCECVRMCVCVCSRPIWICFRLP
jgi:hypothetical protein